METPLLPKPHYAKLMALTKNQRLPKADKKRLQEAMEHYENWIGEMESILPGQDDSVEQLVKAANTYKRYLELEFIFDSPGEFLYRQKGQLKLDNTIIEEFLPQLIYRGLRGIDDSFEFGPMNTFSGLSFSSSLAQTGHGGMPAIRSKNQDFILGKPLYLQTSFDADFSRAERVKSHLGYVCIECKTNLDKTMFQEAVATSRDLKMAVPASLYFLVCEFLDMTPVSIISTQIGDVLIARKSKRMSSNLRQGYTSAKERAEHREEYARFLDSSFYSEDVFQRMIDKIQVLVDDANPDIKKVLQRGHF